MHPIHDGGGSLGGLAGDRQRLCWFAEAQGLNNGTGMASARPFVQAVETDACSRCTYVA